MTGLISSELALSATLLLSQRPVGMRIVDVASALGASYSGAERALEILIADGLASRNQHRFKLDPSSRTEAAVRFALAYADHDAALGALAHGSEAVEFCGVDEAGALIVLRRFTDPADEARLRQALEGLKAAHPGRRLEIVRKEDLRDRLLTDPMPRRRAASMRVLAGSLERSFPDRQDRDHARARPLGGLHPALPTPSLRRLRALARTYGFQRMLAFGSATRSDFRPDSDVDLYVEPTPGRRLGLNARIGLIVDAERIFGHDVDLLTSPVRRPNLLGRIERDGVVLYDAAR